MEAIPIPYYKNTVLIEYTNHEMKFHLTRADAVGKGIKRGKILRMSEKSNLKLKENIENLLKEI